jgi:hypothetical protein
MNKQYSIVFEVWEGEERKSKKRIYCTFVELMMCARQLKLEKIK